MSRKGAGVLTISRFSCAIAVRFFIATGCTSGGSHPKPDGGADGGRNNSDSGGNEIDSSMGGGANACGDVDKCPARATCDRSGSTPTCVCDSGYKLDNNKCVDINECADSKLNTCDGHATCTNKDGGFDCACSAPAYKGDGKTCACALGYS